MKYQDIKPGMTLKLKRERRDAYAMSQDAVYVIALKERPGYSVGHVLCRYDIDSEGYFKPADFSTIVDYVIPA